MEYLLQGKYTNILQELEIEVVDYINCCDREDEREVSRKIEEFKKRFKSVEMKKLNSTNKKIAIRINFAFEHREFIKKQKQDGRDHREVLRKICSF